MKRDDYVILTLVCGVAHFVLATGSADAMSAGQDRAAYIELFEAEGLTEQVFDEVVLWGEGLHLMGRCHRQLRGDQIEHWKTWWDDSLLIDTSIGREVIQEGLEEFDRGVARSASEPLGEAQCGAVIRDWLGEMKQAAEAERGP
jgi:hypothetical protein